MVAGCSSESMTHDPQISISCGQCEGRSELIRLPDRNRRTTTASEQYHSGTAGSHSSLTGSKGRAIGHQFGPVRSLGCCKYCGGPDGNCDQKDYHGNHDNFGRIVSSFGNRQDYSGVRGVPLDRSVTNCMAYK
jgi:hypothetical protein